MLPPDEWYFIQLVKAALDDTVPPDKPDNVKFETVYKIARRQGMTPMAFCVVDRLKNKPEDEIYKRWRSDFLSDCMRNEIQLQALGEAVQGLCDVGIMVIPLKGSVIKQLYPSPVMRVMSDIDLLYSGDAKEAGRVLNKMGYTAEESTNDCHDVYHRPPVICIELHKMLFKADNKYAGALSELLSRAIRDKSRTNLYHLSPEDIYLHTIVHAARHITTSGLGVRPVIDVIVQRRAYADTWDSAYIEKSLKSVGLFDFSETLEKIASAWIDGDGVEDADLQEAERFLFANSAYKAGGEASSAWESNVKSDENSGRLGYILRSVFARRKNLAMKYPVLIKAPILLPLIWIVRFFDMLVSRPRTLLRRLRERKVTKKDVQYTKQILGEFKLLP